MSYNNNNIFEAIKQEIDCMDMARDLGFDINNSGMISCPDPAHEDRNPSCKVYHDSFFCYGCGRRWSCIDMAMQVKSWDLLTAAKWLAERAGIPWPEESEEARQEYERQFNRQEEMTRRLKFWAKNLQPEDLEYFKGRGIAEEFIKEHSFGYCSQKKPQDLGAARELGLLIETKNKKEWYMPGERLVIPFYRYGKVAQVAFHKPGEEPKYLYPAGWPKPLIGTVRRGEKPFLAEGVFCYYSLLQAKLPALTALGTQVSQEQKRELAKAGEFYICFDGDPPGRKAARELAKELFPVARIIELPEGKDLNDLLRELGQEQFKEHLQQAAKEAKNYLALAMDQLEQNPHDEEARGDAMLFTAKLTSGIDRDLKVDQLAKILKPLGIGKTAIRQEVDRQKKELAEQKKAQGEDQEESERDIQYIAEFPGLVDICESSRTGNPCFLMLMGRGEEAELKESNEYTNLNGERFYPPPREQMPWLLTDAGAVMRHFKNDSDQALYYDLRKHFEGISELPGENYYKLLAWWTLHSYLHQKGEYSPYIWLYAVPERGKSRTGKAMIYLAWRGVHVESLRDAYLVRIANNFEASLFFDCMDLWEKAEKQGTEDILLLRFEKGARVARVIYPEKGPFKDTAYYRIFGPTLIATNKQVHNILETRAVQINMPASQKRFENDVKPEDALELKARLTAFRTRHLSGRLPDADKPASGRLGDIMRPLLQVVKLVSPEEEGNFKELLAEIEEARKLEKSTSREAAVVQAVFELENEVESGLLLIKVITEKYNEGVKEKYHLTPAGMGHKLKALGFRKRRTMHGMAIEWDEKLLENLFINYSLAHTLENIHNLHNMQEPCNNGASEHEGFNEGYEGYKNTQQNLHAGDAHSTGLYEGYEGYEGFSEGVYEEEKEKNNSQDNDPDNDLQRGEI